MTPKLILTGFMATGKSTVGPLVASRLGWHFLDSDAEIIARARKPIAQIFADDGETKFRTLERQVIAALADVRRRCPHCRGIHPEVISTGGGALMDDANCDALRKAGVVICLTARPDVIAARVTRSRVVRPKLMQQSGKSTLERVKELMEERREAYARADLQIDSSELSVEQAADLVLTEFSKHATLKGTPLR
jgi:shikimate kinase